MRFEITLISLLVSLFGAICVGELFLAQLTPHSVHYREPHSSVGISSSTYRSGVRNADLGRSARLTCAEPYDPTGPFMFVRNKAHMKKVNFKKDLIFACVRCGHCFGCIRCFVLVDGEPVEVADSVE